MNKLLARVKTLPGRTVLVVLMALMFAFGKYLSPTAAQYVTMIILFPWGFCMLKKDSFSKKTTFRWVCAYLILYLLSTFISMTADVLSAQFVLICSLMMLFVPESHGENDIRREVMILACLMVVLFLPFQLLALVSVFTGKVFHVPLFPSVVGIETAGCVWERIRIFANTNTVAIVAAMNMLFSIHVLFASKKKWVKAFFLFAIAVNYVVLSHTQSRTSGIAFSTAVAALAFRGIYLLLAKRKKLRWIAGAAAALAAFLLVLNGINVIYRTDVSIAMQLTGASSEAVTEAVEVTSRIENEGQFNVNSSGRGDIWCSTLKYIKNHPKILLLGEGQVPAIERISNEYPEVADYLNIHNSYLAAIFYYGIPFLICVLLFLCTLVPPAVRMLLREEERASRGNFIFPITVGMILIIGIGEELLFTTMSYPNLLLYLFAGYLLKLGTPERAKIAPIEKRDTHEN